MNKLAAIFPILMGAAMSGTWAVLLLSDQFPAILSVPLQSAYLLVAEGLTAAALIMGGYGVLTQRQWAPALILVALGELVYWTIHYAGELGQSGGLAGLRSFNSVAVGGLYFSAYLVISA